jgi:hypothetical protein
VYTDGIVVYVSSKEDLIQKMKYYQANPNEVLQKQRRGYEWVKQYGTNRVTAKQIKDKIEDLPFEIKKPIVYLDICGGLGNQLFQIATAYAYAKKEGGQLRIYRREQNEKRCTYWDLFPALDPYLSDIPIENIEEWRELSFQYTAIPPLGKDKQLKGYFQSEKYFDTMKSEINKLFNYTPTYQNRYETLLANKHRVIVVHCRRTDYLMNPTFHGPLPSSYYKQAIQYMNIPDPIYLLCGDDSSYWESIKEDLLIYPQSCVMFHNETDVNTFALLQQFHYFIMSNSTFIWWCVWMADTKHVIAPSKWFGPDGPSSDDIYHPDWERI